MEHVKGESVRKLYDMVKSCRELVEGIDKMVGAGMTVDEACELSATLANRQMDRAAETVIGEPASKAVN